MVRPPEAEPVSAASTLVATASDTSGPPSIAEHPVAHHRESRQRRDHGAEADQARDADRRQHRGIGAGIHALAQAPAAGSSCRTITVAIAAASATTTDQTPATAAIEVPPQRSSARNEKSSRGSTTSDIVRLTATTTTSGRIAAKLDGAASLRRPWRISAGSNSRAVVARSRTFSSFGRRVSRDRAARRNPRRRGAPWLRRA